MRTLSYVRDYFSKFVRHFFVPGAHNAHRPRVLHRPWLIFFLAAILATEGFLVSNLIARQSDQQFLAAVVPAEIIALTNTERADNKLGALTDDALLRQAAQAKADDMASKGYFSHTGPDGKTPWQWISASGYKYQYAGENLAVRFINSVDVVNAWMASPTHRANVVKPVYTEIGVGVAEGMYDGQPATYVVQYFGTPQASGQSAVLPAAVSRPSAPASAAPRVTSTPTPASPSVEGAATSAVIPATAETQNNSFTQSFIRQLIRAFAEPQQTGNFVLGFIATLLIGALIITFFTHVQIQHGGMLAAGVTVAAIALFFFAANTMLVGSVSGGQSASVVTAQGGIVITNEAAETGYALFPN